MNSIEIISKENLMNTYSIKPTLPYDIEGLLVEKEGKNVKVESQIEGKVVTYTLKLKEDVEEKVGEKVKVEKENIVFFKVEEKKEPEDKEIRKFEDLFKEIGIESTLENFKIAHILLTNNIPVTKENIESFFMTKECLNTIREKIDYDKAIKLMKEDIDIEELSLQTVVEIIDDVEVEEGFSLWKFLGLKRDLTYEEAEKIAVDIYGRKMGKDIYDSIIALHKEGIEINKINIERVKEVVYKLHDLKKVEDTTFIKIAKEKLTPNIENLYKVKYSYSTNNIKQNIVSNLYDEFTINTKATKEDIIKLLADIDLESSQENVSLAEQLILNNLDITKEVFGKIKDMRQSLEELTSILNEEKVSALLKNDIDPLKSDIRELLEVAKDDKIFEKVDMKDDRAKQILKKINSLSTVKDEDLIFLLKSGKDFKIENLKDVTLSDIHKESENTGSIVDKVLKISNIINTLDELNSNTIAIASKKFLNINLNNLYESEISLKENFIPVEPIEKAIENLIREEYLKARENISLNIIKESIGEKVDIEYVELSELNDYIDRKINRYKEVEKTIKEVKEIEEKAYDLIPIALKNDLDMSLKELGRINSFKNNENGLGTNINELIKEKENIKKNELRQAINKIEGKAKDISDSLKKGEGKIKEEYKSFIKDIKDLANAFNSQGDERQRQKFKEVEENLKLQKKLSKKDLTLQFPILMEGSFENLQVIIPNLDRGIDREEMTFLLNLNTSNLGNIKFNLDVKGKNIKVKFVADKKHIPKILESEFVFKESLKNIGYNLKDFSIEKEQKFSEENLLIAVDAKV